MTIRIIEDEPEIVLTRSEHARLQREWQASQQMTTMPQDFESWVLQRKLNQERQRFKTGYPCSEFGWRG